MIVLAKHLLLNQVSPDLLPPLLLPASGLCLFLGAGAGGQFPLRAGGTGLWAGEPCPAERELAIKGYNG